MSASCSSARPGYTSLKRLENARLSGTAHRHRAFFTPGIRPDSGRQSPIGGLVGMHSSNAVRCTQSQFSSPARSPAQSRFPAESAGDCSMPNRIAALQPDQATPADVDNVLNQMYALQTDLKILTDQLTRTRDLDLHDSALRHIDFVRAAMRMKAPGLTRH